MRVAAALILIAALTGLPAGASAGAANGLAQNVTTLTEPAQDVTARAPITDPATLETRTTIQDLAIFGLISLGVLGLLWIRRHTSEL